ncbi:MAG: hypothetical protein RL757_1446 [Bacteroidota bacterium]|jgi:electron transfer flavoprotein beta subunit
MKILVCVSKTPDTTAKISFKDGNSTFDGAGVQFIMNPYDEWYALVRAIDLAKATGGTVTLINVGDGESDQIIRKGLALDANDAVRINAQPSSSFFVAKQIADYAKAQNFDVIFTGKETIDHNGSEVGAMIAELLDLPFVSYASKLDFSGNLAVIERDIEGGIEVVEVETPFVMSAAKGLAEQRIPNMMGIMKAKSKPLAILEPTAVVENVKVEAFEMPKQKAGVRYIDPSDMDTLVRLLHEEAKVI